MSINKDSVTFTELADFYNNIQELSLEEKIDIYVGYKNKKENKNNKENDSLLLEQENTSPETEEIKKKILSMFPVSFKGQNLELNFIDNEKKMAVITVYRHNNPISYFAYLAAHGVLEVNFGSYDQAVLACLCKKYTPDLSISLGPYRWINKMLEINKKEQGEDKNEHS